LFFCQFGLHDSTSQSEQLLDVKVMEDMVKICQACFSYLQGKLVDPSMSILYRWSEACGPSPYFPDSLRMRCSKRVELAYYFDTQLNSNIRNINPNFPVFLMNQNEKEHFMECLKQDQFIESILDDVNNGIDRKNITLRLWCGLKDASKTMRKNYDTGRRNEHGQIIQKDYTPHDRRRDFANTVDLMANKNEIYAAGVEAAPYHELTRVGHKGVYLEGVPATSKVWRYVKNKGKSIINLSDMEDQILN
jgi:hypothetical protein